MHWQRMRVCLLPLHPQSRQSPLPASGAPTKTLAVDSPTNAVRKAGLSLAGGITRAHRMCTSPWFHNAGITRCQWNYLISGWKRKGCMTPELNVGSLPRTLWSPDVFTGFNRIQRHSWSAAPPGSSVQWSGITTTPDRPWAGSSRTTGD